MEVDLVASDIGGVKDALAFFPDLRSECRVELQHLINSLKRECNVVEAYNHDA